MNYYDEEISIGGTDAKRLSSIKVDRLPSSGSGTSTGPVRLSGGGATSRSVLGVGGAAAQRNGRPLGRQLNAHNSGDDDGLLHDILDHDDDDDDNDDDSDSDAQKPPNFAMAAAPTLKPGMITSMRSPNPTHSGAKGLLHADDTDEPSETESDDVVGQLRGTNTAAAVQPGRSQSSDTAQLSITPDMWETLSVPQDVKELFPYLLKYTPQSIETQYHLQPFIPEYVPAVGDVDAFLKVTLPTLLQPQRQQEVTQHLNKMGLHFLDEPSGQQSEPSLLNMKLRSVLTGSGANTRSSASASTHLMPTAKSPKDIDKWIAEVEQLHMAQSVFDAQPRKDIDALLALGWPRSWADKRGALLDASQQELSLTAYIRVLCEKFKVEGACETQMDFILNVQTLFALYLAANQAWE